MVNLEWYQSFIAVYQVGTVTGAAQARFLTQPAVTQHLAALELLLGEPLFKRSPRRMIPTERAKELYNEVIQSLERLEQISQGLRINAKSQTQRPLIRLGSPREYFFDVALKKLAQLPYRFRISFGLTTDLLETMKQGELDIIIATQRMTTREVEFHKLSEENFLLVCATTNYHDILTTLPNKAESLSASTGLRKEQEDLKIIENWLSAQNWLSYGVELPIIRRFWQLTFKSRPEFQANLIIPDLHAIQRAVELGYGISLLPDYLCREALEQGRLKLVWEPPKPVTNELWLAYQKTDRNRLELNQIQQFLQV